MFVQDEIPVSNETMQCTVISLSNASRFGKQQKCLSGAENVKESLQNKKRDFLKKESKIKYSACHKTSPSLSFVFAPMYRFFLYYTVRIQDYNFACGSVWM
jgi:hypothetical protein